MAWTPPRGFDKPRPDVDPRILDRLRCPVCGEPLAEATAGTTGALRCPRRHSFDIARQGYVNLLDRPRPARRGHRRDGRRPGGLPRPPGTTTSSRPPSPPPRRKPSVGRRDGADFEAYPLVVDAGAGTGRYLGAVLAALPDAVGLALDVSKPALRRAARAHPRAAAALADTWQRLPLADASTAVLLNVFAPRNGAEFHRVLDPAGALLVVTPDTDHLAELVDVLDLLRVDPDKADRVADSLGGHFTLGQLGSAPGGAGADPAGGRHPGRDGPQRLAHRPGRARRPGWPRCPSRSG